MESNAKDVARHLLQQTMRYDNAVKAAQIRMGVQIIQDARTITPVASGTLANSAFVRVRTLKAGAFVSIGFALRYAAAVHKGEYQRTSKKGRVTKVHIRPHTGQTRFLAKALAHNKANYIEKLAMLTKAYVASGVDPSMVQNPFPYHPPKNVKRFGPVTLAEHQKKEASRARRAANRAARKGRK